MTYYEVQAFIDTCQVLFLALIAIRVSNLATKLSNLIGSIVVEEAPENKDNDSEGAKDVIE